MDSDFEDGLKECLTSYLESSYVFSVSKTTVLDSIMYGNKLRYINHGKDIFLNVSVKTLNVNSTTYICFFANRNINVGEELLFDYGDDYNLDWTKVDNAVTKTLSTFNFLKNKKLGRRSNKKKM
jgi:SET domain-containing protein